MGENSFISLLIFPTEPASLGFGGSPYFVLRQLSKGGPNPFE